MAQDMGLKWYPISEINFRLEGIFRHRVLLFIEDRLPRYKVGIYDNIEGDGYGDLFVVPENWQIAKFYESSIVAVDTVDHITHFSILTPPTKG
jgi:hypothetical protein